MPDMAFEKDCTIGSSVAACIEWVLFWTSCAHPAPLLGRSVFDCCWLHGGSTAPCDVLVCSVAHSRRGDNDGLRYFWVCGGR